MNYTDLVKRLRKKAIDLPEKFSKNADTIDLVMRAAEAIEELQAAQKWIPVTERLPEPEFARCWYLVSLASGCVKTLAYEKQERYDNLWRKGWHETASPVTHWMPLPAPPKEETE